MAKDKKGFFGEFREFIARGNVMDMAVGVIIGAAFKTIIDSLVNDIFMPLIGIVVGAISFSELSVNIGGAVITYGNFISAVMNFLIMAFVIFTLVRSINKVHDKLAAMTKKKQEEAPAVPAAPPAPTEAELLEEILAVLKARGA
ncbi:MAG: large conductance mechanosensitive channel protein MscL [Oscillospiraceae bacterium]